MPSPSVSDFVYAALLYTGESPVSPPSESFVKGTSGEGNKLVFSFQRPDETDGFTLEVFAFKAGTTDFSKEKALLSGKKTGLKVNGEKIEVVETIALSVYASSTEKGTVSLQIKVPDGCSLTIDDTTNFSIAGTSPNFTITQNGTSIPAGKYSVTFTVKKVDETDNTKEEIIHIFPESINVLPGMHTDTWWNGATSSATKVITQDIASTTVYVRGAGGYYDNTPSYNATATADDKNSGSFLAPLATIQKAVDTIIARNDGSSEYTICIDGTLDGTTAEYLGRYGMADFSALAQDLKLTIKALSGTATLDGGARFDADGNVETSGIFRRIIYANLADGKLELTLEKLVITGAFINGRYAGGIYFSSSGGEIKISNGTIICGNKAMHGGGVAVLNGTFDMSGGTIKDCTGTDYGGGVYIFSQGKFIMKGGAIYSNKASYGGGVFVHGGTFTMEGGTISDCTSAMSGGGVFLNYNVTFNMSGTAKITGCKTTSTDSITGGGGIYNAGTLAITGGTISDCTSATSGGGIYNNVTNASMTSTIANCEISGCKANGTASDNGYGGGIYNASGALELTNVNITGGNDIDNPDAKRGGGIYNAGTLTMNGGTISDCTTGNSGGGVYINSGGTFSMSGAAKITDCKMTSTDANTGGGGICNGGTLTITGGEISDCTSATYGGGIYIYTGGTFTMEGGTSTISGNEASVFGGGVCVKGSGSTFKMNDGTIGGSEEECANKAYRGGGISVYGTATFEMSGAAKVSENNDVYLVYSSNTQFAKICVAGALTATTPVATITPSAYTENRPLLTAGEGVTLSGAICEKFAVTPQNNGDGTDTEWRVAFDGTDGTGVLIKKYEMGETGPGGGTVFYYSADGFTVNGKTCHYLEVSKESLGAMKWCPCSACDLAQSTSDNIGAGYANTQAILAHPNHASATASNCAAKACAEYSTDTSAAGEWFLPSSEEAEPIYKITDSDMYIWLSYTWGVSSACYEILKSSGSSRAAQGKSSPMSVRAVRAF